MNGGGETWYAKIHKTMKIDGYASSHNGAP
jgi:hypothetical protein